MTTVICGCLAGLVTIIAIATEAYILLGISQVLSTMAICLCIEDNK